MIPMTLYFGSRSRLSVKYEQLVIDLPDKDLQRKIPISEIGVIELDNGYSTITSACLQQLLAAGVVVLIGDEKHLPGGMLIPLQGHTLTQKHVQAQVQASLPLKKSIWKQLIQAKIRGQAQGLELGDRAAEALEKWAGEVRSGDPENLEARAAAWYWPRFFGDESFRRDPDDLGINAALNYLYAVLRAWVARSLVSAGLLPQLGVFHRNQYNPFPLADDVMEPYRPLADLWVRRLVQARPDLVHLDREAKAHLLRLPQLNVAVGEARPSMVTAIRGTCRSLVKIYLGEEKKLYLPTICPSILTE
ncbi:MAG: type II CRISPR-associated endonuclease Cas1 [Bacteroidota bacterium]